MRITIGSIILLLLIIILAINVSIIPKKSIEILLIIIFVGIVVMLSMHDIMMLFKSYIFNKYLNNSEYIYSKPSISELKHRLFYLNIRNHSFKNPTLFNDGHISKPREYVWFVNKVKVTSQYELLRLINLQVNNKAYNVFEIFTKYKKGKQ